MRIIAGTHRRRPILPPPKRAPVRPITDRVKQSLFDRLAAAGMLSGGCVIDIFSGTGSLGLESLSRGADHCVFVEQDRIARGVLQRNLTDLGLEPRATVLGVNALNPAWTHTLPNHRIGLVFCDPPYQMMREPPSRRRVTSLIQILASVVATECTLILRTDRHAQPEPVPTWSGPMTHRYGSMSVHEYHLAHQPLSCPSTTQPLLEPPSSTSPSAPDQPGPPNAYQPCQTS